MKINRLMEIIIILLNRETITSKELSERFGVSQRTIYRDIDILSSAGVPVYMSKGRGGGISLLKHYTVSKVILSNEERDHMILGLKTLQATNHLSIDHTLEKLKSIFGNMNGLDWLEVDFTHWGSKRNMDERFEMIKKAVLEQKILEFQYVNSKNIKRERRVMPFKIIFKSRAWYLLGFCCEKKCGRIFKITRMRDVKMTNVSFERKEIEKFFEGIKNNDGLVMVQLKLLFDSNMLYRIIDEYSEDQILEQPDGTYIIKAEFPYDEWIYSHILSYGDHVEVIEPEFVKEEIKIRLKNIVKKYKI
ncbi:helix-turn-helix transcriptional regulator [Inediibacterium massiliense]|uniref:helix-turn-helix transcriptional regulator n=1 Tax=Inediibacterium massiliense TaxID=1658111 RepID=UPI0006B5230C|nr:YafY family protein [Inediibacterium massiliense]